MCRFVKGLIARIRQHVRNLFRRRLELDSIEDVLELNRMLEEAECGDSSSQACC